MRLASMRRKNQDGRCTGREWSEPAGLRSPRRALRPVYRLTRFPFPLWAASLFIVESRMRRSAMRASPPRPRGDYNPESGLPGSSNEPAIHADIPVNPVQRPPSQPASAPLHPAPSRPSRTSCSDARTVLTHIRSRLDGHVLPAACQSRLEGTSVSVEEPDPGCASRRWGWR